MFDGAKGGFDGYLERYEKLQAMDTLDQIRIYVGYLFSMNPYMGEDGIGRCIGIFFNLEELEGLDINESAWTCLLRAEYYSMRGKTENINHLGV